MMPTDIKSLIQFLSNDDPLTDCQLCQDELYAYIEAELDGHTFAPQIKIHLDGCRECRQEYEWLRKLLLAERRGNLSQPASEPNFDLSFLGHRPPINVWPVIERAGRQVKRLFTEIPIHLGQKVASFGSLPAPLICQWVAMPVSRATDVQNSAHLLQIPSLEREMAIGLKVGPVSGNTTTISVQVQILRSERLIKGRVTLYDEEHRRLESEQIETEKHETVFHYIGPGDYWLEVEYHNQIWELPLALRPEQE